MRISIAITIQQQKKRKFLKSHVRHNFVIAISLFTRRLLVDQWLLELMFYLLLYAVVSIVLDDDEVNLLNTHCIVRFLFHENP